MKDRDAQRIITGFVYCPVEAMLNELDLDDNLREHLRAKYRQYKGDIITWYQHLDLENRRKVSAWVNKNARAMS